MGFAPQSEAQKSVQFKNGLSLTHSKAQQGGLRAFVSLGAPRARFFKRKGLPLHRLGAEHGRCTARLLRV